MAKSIVSQRCFFSGARQMAVWGYARVSTDDQNTAPQVDALIAAGVPRETLVEEYISGAAKDRPKFVALLLRLQSGDTLMVWKICRLGRNTLAALQTAEEMNARGVRIVITTLGIDMTTPAGKLVFGILAQLAEFEREQIRERINAGMAAAKARGKHLGRRHALTQHQRREAVKLVESGKSLAEVGAILGVHRSIVHRAVQKAKAEHAGA
jgi:DNA invertase Pin-like site-specific DNA recombinase